MTGDDPDDGDGGGAASGLAADPLMKQVLERLANIEETLVSLVDDDGGDDGDGDETDDAEPVMEDEVGGGDDSKPVRDRRTVDQRRGATRKTGDSASLSAGFTDMLSRGEILAPGVSLITFDATFRRGT